MHARIRMRRDASTTINSQLTIYNLQRGAQASQADAILAGCVATVPDLHACRARYAHSVRTASATHAMTLTTNGASIPLSETSRGGAVASCHSGRPVAHQRVSTTMSP